MRQIVVIILLIISVQVSAQLNSSNLPPPDKSPLDMSYYPVNYLILTIQDKAAEPMVMRLIYSRPQLNGRKIFGELQEFGKVWRPGANEANEIEFFKDVKINGKKIKKGRYTLYAIPFQDKWTLIVNKETDIWGSFPYDQSQDIMRMNLPAMKNEITEAMTIVFYKSSA